MARHAAHCALVVVAVVGIVAQPASRELANSALGRRTSLRAFDDSSLFGRIPLRFDVAFTIRNSHGVANSARHNDAGSPKAPQLVDRR